MVYIEIGGAGRCMALLALRPTKFKRQTALTVFLFSQPYAKFFAGVLFYKYGKQKTEPISKKRRYFAPLGGLNGMCCGFIGKTNFKKQKVGADV